MEMWNRARSFAEEAAKRSQELSFGATKLSNIISETTKDIAAKAYKNFPQPSTINDVDLHRFGITEELRDFVKGITITTFEDFPLQDDTELSDVPAVSNIRQDLSEWQEKHASLVLSTVKDDKLNSSEQVKDHKVTMEPLKTELISNQEAQEVKKKTKSSNSSAEQDLDVFLLGEGNSDDEPDGEDGGYDDDLDKLMDNSDDEKGKL